MTSTPLPTTPEEALARGWDAIDIVLITGDAYVDHPSFGAALVARVLEAEGLRLGVLAQPAWEGKRAEADFTRFGKPNIGFFVTGGNIDSMVAHYTVAKKRRGADAYSPGGKTGRRPDRAALVYARCVRRYYGDIPLILGGLEASLRRFAHYDYWDDAVRPSILVESGADLLVYGMGEAQTVEIVRRLAKGEHMRALTDIRGSCYAVDVRDTPWSGLQCPSFEMARDSKKEYARACRTQMLEQDAVTGKAVKQRHGDKMLVQNPPMPPLSTEELDRVYALPFARRWHPAYDSQGGVPALEEVRFSITHNRGCFGACHFCSLAFHQGRAVAARSKASIMEEARALTKHPDFKGYIHDLGGPTANFRFPSCKKQAEQGLCRDQRCLAPKPCAALEAGHAEYLEILRELRQLPGVKKVFIRSGIRFDYLLEDSDERFFRELVEHHVSGQLKVAPEHCSAAVLDAMGKPHIETYLRFARRYAALNRQLGKEQYLVPYLMSSHPGCTLRDAVELAEFLRREGIRPEQVQDFYPTPGTVSTCMYYTGLDPMTMREIFTEKTPHGKAMQRALLQTALPQNRALVLEALRRAGRQDLIGPGKHCLIREDARDDSTAKSKGKRRGR
ncbi:MAG: YgiQ family radical SAM protein [Oscillospiraceae bacterium]|nr:YgiQ family radical SAM protein [Oscillospiraceae bacterium]